MEPEDQALSDALRRMPRRTAPERLKRSLRERYLAQAPGPNGRVARTLLAMAFGASLAIAGIFGWRQHLASEQLFTEAVNDHLRVLYAERPVEIESGGVHQVKPWFSGRLDFAPVLGFGGDEEFPLLGGAVAYFWDRKAAAFQLKRRLHPITLFVFRADGLPWPTGSVPVGKARAALHTERGFHVLLWRKDDLGYALVSDLAPNELSTLAGKIARDD